MDKPFRLTERAARQVALVASHQAGAQGLRIAVNSGGCSGLSYAFEVASASGPDDISIKATDGKVVLVDMASMEFLAGAELDYTDELMGSHFTVRNPNATSACGCGTSFAVD